MKNLSQKDGKKQEEPRAEEKVIPIAIDKITPNGEQKLTICEEDIKKKAENIEVLGQVDPIIVRPFESHKGHFEICKGQGIYEALKYLKQPSAQVIIKNYTVDKGCEIALASLFRNYKLTSIESENHVYWRWKSGKYKSYRDLSKVIPLTPERIGLLIWAKKRREKLSGKDKTNGPLVSTDTIIASKDLSIPEARNFCKLVINGGIPGREVHKAIKYINSRSEDGKKAILNGTVSYDKDRHYIESLYPLLLQILDKITQKLTKTEVIQEAVKKEYPNFTSEIFQLIRILFRELDPSYIDNIEDGTERKQAYSDEDISYAEHTRYMVKREKIDDTLYNLILKQLNFDPKIGEHLKEDGHNCAFESEYQSPKQRELREKLRKVDATRKDPLKALA